MHDYKLEYLENRSRRESNSITNWIYVGIDTRIKYDQYLNFNMAKIGLTTGELSTRASSSQNPYYTILKAFKVMYDVDHKTLSNIESGILEKLSKLYSSPVAHYNSNKESEWFLGNPYEICEKVEELLSEHYSLYMNCYHCDMRDIVVIYSWENEKFLQDKPLNKYCAQDRSNPPPNDSDCYNYGGCGYEECETCGDQWFMKRR